MLSGGVTTDICVYKLQDGRFGEQYGKHSAQQKVQPKTRHIPPFPFKTVARTSNDVLTFLNGSGHCLDLFSLSSKQQLLQLSKKGDFGITCFDQAAESSNRSILIYSDSFDTQVFKYEDLQVTKLTKVLCHQNSMS